MFRIFYLSIILFSSAMMLVGQSINDTTSIPIHTLSEPQLIEGLSSNSLIYRDSCALEIRQRILNNALIVKPGNVIGHSHEYWLDKVKKLPIKLKKKDFIEIFEVADTLLVPDQDNFYFIYLDNMFLLRAEDKKKKIKLLEILYWPLVFNVEPMGNFTGTWRMYHCTGILHSTTEYVEGIKQGKEIIYRHDGVKSWEKINFNDEMVELFSFKLDGTKEKMNVEMYK